MPVNSHGLERKGNDVTLKYGGEYRLKNGWGDWKGGYLDGNPENHTVCTGDYNQRLDSRVDGPYSVWRIESATGKTRNEPVLTNDVVYLKIGGGAGYLDTAGQGCNGNLLCTSLSREKPSDTGLWRIRINDGDEAVEIGDWVGFHVQSGRNDWSGGYLATRGRAEGTNWAKSVPLLLAVSTHKNWDGGDNRSAMWRVEPSNL